jgi:hypothetical protein
MSDNLNRDYLFAKDIILRILLLGQDHVEAMTTSFQNACCYSLQNLNILIYLIAHNF